MNELIIDLFAGGGGAICVSHQCPERMVCSRHQCRHTFREIKAANCAGLVNDFFSQSLREERAAKPGQGLGGS